MRAMRVRGNASRMSVRPIHRRSAIGVIAGLALSAVAGSAATALAGEKADLQVTRVGIFSSGVAFYECEANVTDDATAELDFRTSQINDIIKSMIVQDLGGGTVGLVSYASRDPIEKTFKSLGVDITGRPTLAALLDQLRGEPVEIAGAKAVKGVILGVEKQKVTTQAGVIEYDVLNVLTDGGIQQLKVSEIGGIKLTNEKVDAELRKALATLATAHDADKKSVLLHFNGKGQRKVRVAYLLEAPIWKTSYRLAIDEEGKPFLQGWATVENATEEDWRNVKLSLISGRPISFTMDLYSPLYVPRPKEELELYASLRPPTYEGDMTADARKPAAPAAARAAPGTVAGSAPMERSEAFKRNSILYSLDPKSGGSKELEDSLDLLEGGVESVANASTAGELFEYGIKTPVSIPRQHSAMLPIINQAIEGEKVSIYNPGQHAKHPLNGLQITNTSGLNLMQGPVTVFDSNVYAGDAKLPDVKPNEKRLIAYALDLGVEVAIEGASQPDQLVGVKISKGVLIHKHKYIDDRTYVLKNKTEKPRTVLVEQAYGDEWGLIEPKQPTERTAAKVSRFKVAIEPGKTARQRVAIEQVSDQTVAISSMAIDHIQFYLRQSKVVSKQVQEALQKVIELRTALDAAGRARQQAEQKMTETVAEQGRVRENLNTLKDESDARKRQMKKFDELETQIEAARAKIDELRAAESDKRAALEAYLLELTVE